jgi:hypothetical protein
MFLTSVNGRTSSTQITKKDWSGTQIGSKLIKALVLDVWMELEKGAQPQSWYPHHGIPD